MIGWLWRILVGRFTSCRHEWETVGRIALVASSKDTCPIGHCYHLRCKKCGDYKQRRFL